MGVYIKNREMPNNCQECVCINDEYFYCQAVGRQPQDENIISRRQNWCPIADVPTPHGRLIDADALKAWFVEWYDLNADLEIIHFLEILSDEYCAPTIIEAEE